MARDLTAGMIAQFTASELSPIFLFKAEFDSGNVNLWTGYGEITFNSDTYTGAGELLALEEIPETRDLVAGLTVITLTGLDQTIINLALTEDYQSRPVSIYFGALSSAGALIADPYLTLKARMDVMELSDDGTTGTASLTVVGILTDLEKPKVGKYTDEDQKSRYAGDLFFEFVETLQEKEIVLEKGTG